MILLCDEDVGSGIPRALEAVGYNAQALVDIGLGGRPDTEWLAIAGARGWLVYSHNKRMLAVEYERQAIIDHKVGIVFLTTGEERTANQLRMLLNRWPALEYLDANTPRPFARFIRPNGRMTAEYTYRGMLLSIR